MKKLILLLPVLFCACAAETPRAPREFAYKEISSGGVPLASWSKFSEGRAACKVYIEGDGRSFTSHGKPTKDPTPKIKTARELAFKDPSPDVVYLGRPCQYVKGESCAREMWTTARFGPDAVKPTVSAVKELCGKKEIIFIGYSGGAQMAGLAAVEGGLRVKKIITVAGNLDHRAWTVFHKLPPLDKSLNMRDYKAELAGIEKIHYAGEKDKVMPAVLIKNAAGKELVIVVPGAGHAGDFNSIYPFIWNER